ncbi:hypothetical protein [Halovenus halobia]|uniref:hypothetical protein n=1 Tax=Halovenus halobia TaxID=3396622 RepID=UPI003F5438F8
MYVPFHSQTQAKDAIAAELLDKDATEAIDEAYADALEATAGIESRAGTPAFLNDERETDIDIVTGDAE